MSDALIAQVEEHLDGLDWSCLTQENVDSEIPPASRNALGVYVLGLRVNPKQVPSTVEDGAAQTIRDGSKARNVYVGQSRSAIYTRLAKHAGFVRDRCGLSQSQVVFKAAEIVIFDSISIETSLIEKFGTKWSKDDPDCGWNGSGFGSNDTGGNRDNQATSHFNLRWPIDINVKRAGAFQGRKRAESFGGTIKQAITKLARSRPYTIRVHKSWAGHIDLNTRIELVDRERSTYEAVQDILSAFPYPSDWVARVYSAMIVFHREKGKSAVDADPKCWPPDFKSQHYVVIRAARKRKLR